MTARGEEEERVFRLADSLSIFLIIRREVGRSRRLRGL